MSLITETNQQYYQGAQGFSGDNTTLAFKTTFDTDLVLENFLVNRKSMHADALKQIPLALINQEMTCLLGSLNFINKISQDRN